VFAEIETNLRRERQLESVSAAKARGVYRGRPPLIDAAEVMRLRREERLGRRQSRGGSATVGQVFIACSKKTGSLSRQTGVPMPIRPEMREFYPSNWLEISRQVRFERAAGVCQGCGRPHGNTVRCLPAFHRGRLQKLASDHPLRAINEREIAVGAGKAPDPFGAP
jgi:hypothetical protein